MGSMIDSLRKVLEMGLEKTGYTTQEKRRILNRWVEELEDAKSLDELADIYSKCARGIEINVNDDMELYDVRAVAKVLNNLNEEMKELDKEAADRLDAIRTDEQSELKEEHIFDKNPFIDDKSPFSLDDSTTSKEEDEEVKKKHTKVKKSPFEMDR